MKNLVSVIIPNYNNSVLLSEIINCIIKQTYSYWELLIVDDGSTDDSVEIVREFESKDPRIKIICRSEDPKGGQKCRNIGLGCAKGVYVCVFDSDDLISSGCLMQRVRCMDMHPEIDFAVFPAYSFKNGSDPYTVTRRSVKWGKKM